VPAEKPGGVEHGGDRPAAACLEVAARDPGQKAVGIERRDAPERLAIEGHRLVVRMVVREIGARDEEALRRRAGDAGQHLPQFARRVPVLPAITIGTSRKDESCRWRNGSCTSSACSSSCTALRTKMCPDSRVSACTSSRSIGTSPSGVRNASPSHRATPANAAWWLGPTRKTRATRAGSSSR